MKRPLGTLSVMTGATESLMVTREVASHCPHRALQCGMTLRAAPEGHVDVLPTATWAEDDGTRPLASGPRRLFTVEVAA